jgi:peptidoglycan/xylan/chitin deacetylase (PgdA/CDA1 family)
MAERVRSSGPLDRAGAVAARAVDAARGRRPPFALCYHGIGDLPAEQDPHGLLVTERRFTEHVDLLLGRGYRLVSAETLWAAVRDHGPRGADGLGAITFDDGLADTLHTAAQVLGARGATATAFLAPGLLGADHPDLPPGHRILREDELRPLEASGIAIGAHSLAHADLPSLPRGAARAELRDSRLALEALLGHPVTTMAYPFGRHDARTRQDAADAGYTVACACAGAGPWEALALPREPVFPSTTAARIRVKAAGLYGPLQAVSVARSRLRGGRA